MRRSVPRSTVLGRPLNRPLRLNHRLSSPHLGLTDLGPKRYRSRHLRPFNNLVPPNRKKAHFTLILTMEGAIPLTLLMYSVKDISRISSQTTSCSRCMYKRTIRETGVPYLSTIYSIFSFLHTQSLFTTSL